MGKELNPEFYDRFYLKRDGGNLKSPDMYGCYYQVWCCAIKHIQCYFPHVKQILELGCGSGEFAALIKSSLQDLNVYKGYDFSQQAIHQAQARNTGDGRLHFKTRDLSDFKFLDCQSETVICSYEFLEHVSFDLKLIDKIPLGAYISFSVPSFDSEGHVRWFDSISAVKERYSGLVFILESEEIWVNQWQKIYVCFGRRVTFF